MPLWGAKMRSLHLHLIFCVGDHLGTWLKEEFSLLVNDVSDAVYLLGLQNGRVFGCEGG